MRRLLYLLFGVAELFFEHVARLIVLVLLLLETLEGYLQSVVVLLEALDLLLLAVLLLQ